MHLANGPVLLYMGSAERLRRPKLRALFDTVNAPEWLAPVARGDEGGGWVMYQAERRSPDESFPKK